MRRPIARVQCDLDGPIDMNVSDLTIRHCLTTGWCEYRFICPRCGRIQLWRVSHARTADVLGLTSFANYSRPAKLEEWRLSEAWYERHDGPQLTALDAIQLAIELDGLPSASDR